MGGTAASADVWRCTKTICSEQADWTKVADNGFGVPQNQYLYAGAVSDGYLYGAVDNPTTGMQLWRTANGTDWEKATPYDGLGNSNNRYVYAGAMTVFNSRLTLGITNWASGVSVWQKTLTADFTATPRAARAAERAVHRHLGRRHHDPPVGLRGWCDEHGEKPDAHVYRSRHVCGDAHDRRWDGHEHAHEAGLHRGEALHVSAAGDAELGSAAV